MHRLSLFLCGLCLLFATGCSVMDVATQSVDLDAAQGHVSDLETVLATTTAQVGALKLQLADAQAAFVASHSDAAAQVVSRLQVAVGVAEAALPQIQAAVTTAKTTVATLKSQVGSSAPLWKVVALAALPFVPRLLSLIPGLGPVAAPLASLLSNMAWTVMGTAGQKQQDADHAAAAKALPFQVDFAHDLLQQLPAERAQAIKDEHSKVQELAGVHATIRPLVLAAETTPSAVAA